MGGGRGIWKSNSGRVKATTRDGYGRCKPYIKLSACQPGNTTSIQLVCQGIGYNSSIQFVYQSHCHCTANIKHSVCENINRTHESTHSLYEECGSQSGVDDHHSLANNLASATILCGFTIITFGGPLAKNIAFATVLSSESTRPPDEGMVFGMSNGLCVGRCRSPDIFASGYASYFAEQKRMYVCVCAGLAQFPERSLSG